MFLPFFVATWQLAFLAAPTPTPAPAPTPDAAPAPSELVRRLSKGEVKAGALVDPKRGLVWVDHFEGPGDEPEKPFKPVAKKLCGAALEKERADIEERVADAAKRTLEARDGDTVACEAEFGGTRCTVGASMEWDPALHLVFDKVAANKTAPEHYVLRAVLIDDEVLVSEEDVKAKRAKLDQAAKKFVARKCK